MADTLNTINAKAKFLARDTNLNITADSSEGILAANRVYRQFSALWQWPELQRQQTFTTVAAQEKYSATALASMRDILRIEMQDDRDSDAYALIGPANSQPRWVRAGYEAAGFPDLYQVESSAGVPKLAVRPAPNTAQATNTIRVVGQITPTDLSASSTTFCRNALADDALAYMIAADYQLKRGQTGEGMRLLAESLKLVKAVGGPEIVPAELAEKLDKAGA